MFDCLGGGNDSCIPESFWSEIYDGRPESVLCTMAAVSYAEYVSNILRHTSNKENLEGCWSMT